MKKTSLFLLLLILCTSYRLRAQSFSLITGREPVASLDGLWRFHVGDNATWANPSFDDSQWPLLRSDESWSEQGYPGYSGMAWYRFTVTVPAGMDSVSLMLPQFRTSYQVYANGVLIGTYGKMPPHGVAYSGGDDSVYALPRATGTDQTIEIAIRVWQWKGWAKYRGGGPMTGGGLIGQSKMVADRSTSLVHSNLWNHSSPMILALLQTLAGITALALFLLRRSEREYLWFSVFILLAGAGNAWLVVYETSHAWNVVLSNDLNDGVRAVCASLAEMLFYLYLLKGKRTLLYWSGVICLFILMPIVGPFFWGHLHLWSAPARNSFQAVLRLPMYAWILILLLTRVRQNLPDARLLLAPVLLQETVTLFQYAAVVTLDLGWQHKLGYNIPMTNRPFAITMQQAADALFLLAVLAILIYRFTRTRREEERYASEMEAGRNMQSLLVPTIAPSTPGFRTESVYFPASEVGGDFFQVVPGDNGSLLIVVGDVSGKGLKAAMTVSAIVGALRGCVTRKPSDVLRYLNRVLCGQISGFVTCSAALITAEGAMTIANAGNPAPYLNGTEVAGASGLPLGILAEGGYEERCFELEDGDRLTFVSDGVVEATNEKKELFGFERTQAISHRPAQDIAATAQAFGQVDDICVLAVTRLATKKVAIA